MGILFFFYLQGCCQPSDKRDKMMPFGASYFVHTEINRMEMQGLKAHVKCWRFLIHQEKGNRVDVHTPSWEPCLPLPALHLQYWTVRRALPLATVRSSVEWVSSSLCIKKHFLSFQQIWIEELPYARHCPEHHRSSGDDKNILISKQLGKSEEVLCKYSQDSQGRLGGDPKLWDEL